MLLEVPYDPYLVHLFQGEEFLHSARLWTNGYNFYMPNKNYCSHNYGRKNEKKSWNDHTSWKKHENNALLRLKYILGLVNKDNIKNKNYLKYIENYGLGKVRTLKEYENFSGIDLKNKKTKNLCNKSYSYDTKNWS